MGQAVIGQRLLSSLKPQAKPYEVRDTKVKGFILRVQPSGVQTYICEYARGKRITVGRAYTLTPTQARNRAIEILARTHAGEDPNAERPNRAHTLRRFIEEKYRPWVKVHHRSSADTLWRFESRFGWLLDHPLSEINVRELERWRTERLHQGRTATTVNRDLAPLKAALTKAVEWRLLKANPLTAIKPLKVDHHGVVRYLSEDEERRLRAALDACRYDYLKPMVLVSLNTGVRRGELFNLAWADVDLARANLTVRGYSAKSRQSRHIPLNTEAVAVLNAWKAGNAEGLVFPGRTGERLDNTRKSWASVLREAGITGFRWHDLRHHFASKLVMAGVDLNTVRELLGHADTKMTLRYAHLSPEHRAEAVERLTSEKIIRKTIRSRSARLVPAVKAGGNARDVF